jgi:hypothetical protein
MDPPRSHYYSSQYNNVIVYPQLLSNPATSHPDPHTQQQPQLHQPHERESAQKSADPPKSESKPQATFLTKLYASVTLMSRSATRSPRLFTSSLLERPENHHMIRWDAAGDHIIVEKPEQLALHVLPSIYRQSRFASFSRQLNVGFPSLGLWTRVDRALDLWLHAQGQSA